MHILILAGGGGTRLWPLSRQDFPKQFLRFGDENTLLQKSVSRFLNAPSTETITIATNAQYAPLVEGQLKKIDPNHKAKILIEPARKNTAPAIAFALKYLQEKLGVKNDASVLVLPSDHLIEPQAVFSQYLERIEPLIQNQRLVLFGILPTKPETGYGYIQLGQKFDTNTYIVKRFVEKPDSALAQSYLSSGGYYWNAGMFAFSIAHFWQNLQQYAPDIASLLQGNIEDAELLFEKMPDISFDYAVLEKCQNILVCPLPVAWSDVGCWDSVYDVMSKDENQNVKYGNIVAIDTKNSLIIGGKRLISTIGLDDLLIVETEDATFISKRGESQKVKSMVQQLLKIGCKEGANHAIQRFPWGAIELLDANLEYCMQKIQIDALQHWEPSSISEGTLVLLSGSAHLKVDEQPVPMLIRKFISIAQNQKIHVANAAETTLELLFLSAAAANS
jgi:mannose-1-phosphate guanylyltransferase/mannose-6-phosphate isomerase